MSDSKELQKHISGGNTAAVAKMLQKKPELATKVLPSGISPLMLALYHRNAEMAGLLHSHYKSLNLYEAAALGDVLQMDLILNTLPELMDKPAKDGFSALGLAAFFGQTEAVAYLITKGADVNLASENDFKVTPLHSAVATNNIEIARLLLDNLANPNCAQTGGVTPLHSAAHIGNREIAELLLERGANQKAVLDDGKTPADLALDAGHKALAQWLKKL